MKTQTLLLVDFCNHVVSNYAGAEIREEDRKGGTYCGRVCAVLQLNSKYSKYIVVNSCCSDRVKRVIISLFHM